MRHLPENLLAPLLRILDEYEAGVKAKPKRTLADHTKLYHASRIRNALERRYEYKPIKKHNNDFQSPQEQ